MSVRRDTRQWIIVDDVRSPLAMFGFMVLPAGLDFTGTFRSVERRERRVVVGLLTDLGYLLRVLHRAVGADDDNRP